MDFLLGVLTGFIIGSFQSLLTLNLIGYHNEKNERAKKTN